MSMFILIVYAYPFVVVFVNLHKRPIQIALLGWLIQMENRATGLEGIVSNRTNLYIYDSMLKYSTESYFPPSHKKIRHIRRFAFADKEIR